MDLSRRLIFALFLPLLLILLGSSVFDYRLAKQTADAAHDQALADNIFDLEGHIRQQNPQTTLDVTREAAAMVHSNEPDIVFFAIRDAASGKLLAGDTYLPDIPLPVGDDVRFADGDHHGKAVRIAVHHMIQAGWDLHVAVIETTTKRLQSSERIRTAMILPNLAVIIVTLLAVLAGVRHGLLPLREVEREIALRSESDLREIDLSGTPSEIRPMLRRLNELFAALRQSTEAQQRFIADAAHQLRTPLAGLQTHIDLAAAEGAFGQDRERLGEIEAATGRIGRLLTQLLTHARAESANSIAAEFELVRLDQLVEEAATTFLDAALAKDLDLGFEIAPAATRGLPWMLREALANLIDNAIRYTPAGGVVTVHCGEKGGSPFLEVEDSGPGIPEPHSGQVFERFYRIPGSPGNGCGLGLAIVSEIARLHGATIRLANGNQGGLRVRLSFVPTAEEPAKGPSLQVT